jgi:deoxyribodipyrimidine photo-lyase
MATRVPVSLVWLRRDLRLDDHAVLDAAARASERVACAFVLDPVLLRGPRVGAPIVQCFFDALGDLRERLRAHGTDLVLFEGDAPTELLALARRIGARAVFYGRDVDPDALARDARAEAAFRDRGLLVRAIEDQVYYAADEVTQNSGKPYGVYTPYRRRWEARLAADPRPPLRSERTLAPRLLTRDVLGASREVPRPEDYGHASSVAYPRGGVAEADMLLRTFIEGRATAYAEQRNIPSVEGTSRLSPHLRAGTIGIRRLVHAALEASATWLGELIWRDFYQQLLAHHPRIAHEPFLAAAHAIRYRESDEDWRAWCEGRTGYPIVDAAMRQLNETGWMHNRLRMIVASFLTKHLLLDYRRGERYFEQHLADADLAANNGGWQWSASTGTDAAPYFRVFNPTTQGKTFDPNGAFVRAWLPALARVPGRYVHAPWEMPPLLQAESGCVLGRDYPAPIVDHAFARTRALAVYGAALARGRTSA